jgi:hypothetical protein
VVGLLELDCEVLLSHEHHHQLVVYTARPGTESHERLQLLRMAGPSWGPLDPRSSNAGGAERNPARPAFEDEARSGPK